MQLKDFISISASLINRMRAVQTKITDFNVGSVARSLLDAPAVEIEELYQQMFAGIREAIPVAVFNAFGFERLPVTVAVDIVRFSTGVAPSSPVFIPAGTRVRQPNGGVTYATAADSFVIAPNFFVDLLVTASVAGAAGNAMADTVTELVAPVNGIVSVTNPASIQSGRDQETDEARIERFNSYVASLPRGTSDAIEFGARSAFLQNSAGSITESVQFALVVEPYLSNPSLPVGLVEVYVHNGVGATSPALVGFAQDVVDGYYLPDGTPVFGYKAAGVVANVYAATDIVVGSSGVIEALGGFDISAIKLRAETDVKAYISSLKIGMPVLRNEIVSIIMDIAGVYNVTLPDPAADIAVAYNAKARAGLVIYSVTLA